MKHEKGLPANGLSRRRWQSGNTTLTVMLVVAAAALLFGFLVIRQRSKTPSSSPQASQNSSANSAQNQTPQTDQTLADKPADQAQIDMAAAIAGWKVYANDKHGFQLNYPPNLKVGSISKNSVLGTFQAPVKGFHVGPLVLVVLKDPTIKQTAVDNFNGSYNEALHPQASAGGEAPVTVCAVDKVSNPDVVSIKSVSCTGEGGAARYAYIQGQAYDVFVDGYSKGFDSADNGSFAKDTDYINILSTFKFSIDSAVNTQSTTPVTSTIPTPATTKPVIKTFSISADDSAATPGEITVAKGTIVEITFNVSASDVYYGGLDFRSAVVNSGTVNAGGSKTISFTADQSFAFTPYWPAQNIAKNYTIKVTVQ
ncbi:MAG: hypothetical protein ABI643_04295 [Candidatus Doudnabacteria bacterium]